MVSRYTIIGAALLLLAIFNALSSVDAEPTLKDLMLQDQAAKKHASGGPAPTQNPAARTTAKPSSVKAKPSKLDKKDKPAKPHSGSHGSHKKTTPVPHVKKAKASRSPSAAPAFAHESVAQVIQAPIMQGSSSGGSSTGHAALGTSAMIGIGVGVGVACLVAVGAVVGVMVHLRRRKNKGTQLEKQKTYGGTE